MPQLAEDFLTKANTPVDLFLGRVQPVTNGHVKVIQKMKSPVVAIVRGAKTSQNKKKNPLDETIQKRLVQKAFPSAIVVVVGTGYVPDIVNQLRKDNLEVMKIYAGSDRAKGYRAQINKQNETLLEDQKITSEVIEIERTNNDFSATKVREAIKEGNEILFRSMVPSSIHSEWNTLRALLINKTPT